MIGIHTIKRKLIIEEKQKKFNKLTAFVSKQTAFANPKIKYSNKDPNITLTSLGDKFCRTTDQPRDMTHKKNNTVHELKW